MLGIGTSLRSSRGLRSSVAFNPAVLFRLTDTGWVYDHSDFSTIFQDAAGTIPVTAVGQPVGLQLDKSKGLVLGPELVTNGTFDSGTTGWGNFNANSSLSVVGGALRVFINSGTNGYATQTLTTVVGKTYAVAFNIVQTTKSTTRFLIGTGNGAANLYAGSNLATGARTAVFTATTTSTFLTVGLDNVVAGDSIDFDNISVRERPGNHRTQPISLNRPTLRQDAGGLYYLEYDGINDSMATASFAWGTDKATVVAGVRKLSDAALGILVEFGTSVFFTSGTWNHILPDTTLAGLLGLDLRGSGTSGIQRVSTGTAPATFVSAVSFDLAGTTFDTERPVKRINGVDVASGSNAGSTDTGGGNFTSQQTFFGARAGTSLYFNGREYSQFAINRLLTTAELAQIEAYTAGKTGVVL